MMTFNSDKTEIMLFSNTDIPEFNFTFNERTIPITNSHKHLGVTFSSDAKLILCINPLCQTLSNALEKSQNTKQLISFFSSEFKMQLYISNSWCTVEYFGRQLEDCTCDCYFKKR
jgi:hypothetical protein